jgi:hypothetical protein
MPAIGAVRLNQLMIFLLIGHLLRISIMRMSPAGDPRPSCSRATKRTGLQSILPSCRTCCGANALKSARRRQSDFSFCVEWLFSQVFIMARACNSAFSRGPLTTFPFISTPAG